jgi:eukaryotic-like serine/threonine-protein kinase
VDVSAVGADVEPLRRSDPATIGPYRLLGRLGAGGMGEVFLGRDRAGRLSAVKLVHDAFAGDPTFRARFAREVRIARTIRIASTAAVIEADPDAPVPWLATEYIDGPTLDRLVAAQGPMTEPAAGELAARLAATLAELHAAGVAHRDVKPSNVLIAPDGPRLIDFGIASAADATAITRSGTLLGAPEYMSPEQALGTSAGPPADVFSLAGVVVYAVTGHGPFGSAAHPVAMVRRIIDEPPNLEDVPDGLRVLLEPCLAKDPTSRPSAGELADRLRRRFPTADAPVDDRAQVLGRRRLLRAAALGVAVAGGAATAGVAAVRGMALLSDPGPARGVIRWTFDDLSWGSFSGLLFGAGLVIADSGESVYALEPRDGSLRWKVETRGMAWGFRTTTCVRDTVYSADRQGIFALDAKTGRLRWEQRGAEVLTASDTVLLGRTAGHRNIDGGDLFGIDLDTGDTRWRHPIPDTVTQLAASEGLLHVGFRGTLTTFDANSGAVRWAIPWMSGNAVGGLSTNGDGLISAQSGRLISLNTATGEIRWTVPFNGSHGTAPTMRGGTVFVNEGGRASARVAGTGRLLWSTAALGDPEKAIFVLEPAVLGSSVYLLASSDPEEANSVEICALDTEVGAYEWTIPLNASLTNTPASPVTTTDTVCVATHRAVLSVGP